MDMSGIELTMADIRQMNAAAGGFFFSRDTVRTFATKTHGRPVRAGACWLFITSDDVGTGGRVFTVRRMLPTGTIMSDCLKHATLDGARARIRLLVPDAAR